MTRSTSPDQSFQTTISRSSLYSGSVELVFNPRNHTYLANGIRVPSVTKICGVIDKSGPLIGWALNNALAICKGGVQPDTPYPEVYLEQVWTTAKRAYRDVKEEAASIGTDAHRAIEENLRGGSVFPSEETPVGQCVSAAHQWIREHDLRMLEIERRIYSRKHRYSGTLDYLAYVDGELALVDWKSSKGVWPEYWLQTAAYQAAYEEETGTRIQCRHIIKLGKTDGTFEVHTRRSVKDYKKDLRAFLGALNLVRRLEELKGTQ